MLVMRNFGYLGLHAVVDSKSSLARNRLVDFTGELQLRRRTDDDSRARRRRRQESDNYTVKAHGWHPRYIAEPVENGGRTTPEAMLEVGDAGNISTSKLYAQELAPLPLMLAPSSRLSTGPHAGMAHVRPNQADIEPFYYTSFCNELICHPRILHNCHRGHISIKVELREVEWNDSINAYLAHMPGPGIGPGIHNTRRGPFLVHSAFTACTSRQGDHQFIDEIKVKLPLDLNPKTANGKALSLSLFFTVYRVKTGSKSVWKRGAKKIFGSSILNTLGTSSEDTETTGRIEQVACGFLPVISQSCLLDNGIHDVRVGYVAQEPTENMRTSGVATLSSLLLVERDLLDGGPSRDESFAEDSTLSDISLTGRPRDVSTSVHRTDSNPDLHALHDDSAAKSVKNNVPGEPISLSVSQLGRRRCDLACN